MAYTNVCKQSLLYEGELVPCMVDGRKIIIMWADGGDWFWPDTQPRMTRLVAELGLKSFPQHDTGSMLRLTDHDKKPDTIQVVDLHGGARRLEGGMAALVEALAGVLPPAAIHLEQELLAVHDQGGHVELQFRSNDVTQIVRARRAVLAIPPRLLDERVRFEPALDQTTREAMHATHTWMADQAKVVVGYERPFWRQAASPEQREAYGRLPGAIRLIDTISGWHAEHANKAHGD